MNVCTNPEHTADLLNRLLRGEMSAVSAYDIALEKIEPTHTEALRTCRKSHDQRCKMLTDRVRACGGEPSEGPGVWGAVTDTLTTSAKMLGENRIIGILEEGEDHGNKEYTKALDDDKADAATLTWIRDRVFVDQLRTHNIMSSLQRSAA